VPGSIEARYITADRPEPIPPSAATATSSRARAPAARVGELPRPHPPSAGLRARVLLPLMVLALALMARVVVRAPRKIRQPACGIAPRGLEKWSTPLRIMRPVPPTFSPTGILSPPSGNSLGLVYDIPTPLRHSLARPSGLGQASPYLRRLALPLFRRSAVASSNLELHGVDLMR
jgi:hypothetical protein